MYYWIAVDSHYQIYSIGGYAEYSKAVLDLHDFIENYVVANGEGIMNYKVKKVES